MRIRTSRCQGTYELRKKGWFEYTLNLLVTPLKGKRVIQRNPTHDFDTYTQLSLDLSPPFRRRDLDALTML